MLYEMDEGHCHEDGYSRGVVLGAQQTDTDVAEGMREAWITVHENDYLNTPSKRAAFRDGFSEGFNEGLQADTEGDME
jgi:hypothetical protein